MTESGGDLFLVTGASGFVGSAIANAARAAGHRVRVLVRGSSPRTNIHPDDEVVIGDIRDRASLVAALRGVRYLAHAAADYRLWAPAPDEIIRTNVEGTRYVMEEALRAGVERIVYTSSVATLELRDDCSVRRNPSAPGEQGDRRLQEKQGHCRTAGRADGGAAMRLPAVIVNPSTPIGPRDVKPTPTGRIIVECACGRMPGFVDTGLNLVHVDDVAAGHLAALRRGRIGERYILGGENVPARHHARRHRRHRRSPSAEVAVSHRARSIPLALGAEAWARLTGKEPFATRDGLRMARHYMFFDDAKARRELGYASRPYREAIADAIAWFRQAGYIR